MGIEGYLVNAHPWKEDLIGGLLRDNTPPKFNMEPKKKSPEKEVPLGNHHFQVPC